MKEALAQAGFCISVEVRLSHDTDGDKNNYEEALMRLKSASSSTITIIFTEEKVGTHLILEERNECGSFSFLS